MPPGAAPTESPYQKYRDRCLKATTEISRAGVAFDPEIEMTRGASSTVVAVVTLNTQLPPDQVLPGRGATTEQLYVACEIQGSLNGDADEFHIQPEGWQSRSLVGDQDAEWTWIVKPKLGGTRSLVMELRPVVRIADVSGQLRIEAMTTASFESTVHVDVPADQAVTDVATRGKVMFDSLSGLVQAMTLLVAALITLGGALGIRGLARWLLRRRRRRHAGAESESAPAPHPSGQS